jgi:hypothetical protein
MKKTAVILLALGLTGQALAPRGAAQPAGYAALVELFADWRRVQRPGVVAGVPDYGPAAIEDQRHRLAAIRGRLAAIEPAALTASERIDRRLVEAEMNGLDFDLRVLRPWSRNPAFYAMAIESQSDTPLREGPTIEGAIELWRYSLPLPAPEAEALRLRLRAIPPVLAQARANLTEDARDLWLVGIRTHRGQARVLAAFAERLRPHHPDLVPDVERAREAENAFRAWLEAGLPAKQGRSGVGRENYDWYTRNVHLLPYTWQDELVLMERELARALAHLALEEHRNRALPPLEPAADAAEWQRRADTGFAFYMGFLREKQVMTMRDYLEPALRFACERTPRGWLRPDGDTVWGEQQLYLEQPGYGTSYLTGKAMIEALMAERARTLGAAFTLGRFMDELNASGMLPVSLIREEIAGN